MYKRALHLQLLGTSPKRLRSVYRDLLQVFQCFCRILPPALLIKAAEMLPNADLYIALDAEVLALLPPLTKPLRLWSETDLPAVKLQGIIGGLRLLHRLEAEENL
jgi:hypothetical protein